jgi:hypothetical protein
LARNVAKHDTWKCSRLQAGNAYLILYNAALVAGWCALLLLYCHGCDRYDDRAARLGPTGDTAYILRSRLCF